MSSSNVCPSSVEELGDKEGPIPTNAGPASNVIEPKPGKATSAVASPSQALEDSTIIDTSGDSMSHPLQQNTVRTWPEYRHALSHNTNTTIRSHPISHFGSLPTRRLWSINSPRSLQTSLPEPSLAHEATSNEFHPISHFGLLLTRQLWAVRRPQFHLTAPPSESSHSHEAPLNQFHLISHFGSLPTRGLWLYRRPQIHLTAPPSEPLPSRVTSSPTHALPLDTALPTESIHSHEALLNQFHPISHFGSLPTRGLWLYRRPQIHLTAPPSEPLPSRILARVTSPAHPLPLDTTLYPEPVLSRVTSLVHTLPLDTALLRQTSPQVEPLQPETRSPSKAISPPYSSPLRSQNSLPLQTYLNPESRSTSEFVSPTFTPPSPLKTSFPSNNPDHFAASLTNTSLLLETPLSAEAQLVTLNSSSVHDETLQTEQHHPDVVNPDLTVSYQTPVGPTEATSLNQPPITDPTTAPVESLSQLPHVPSNNSSSHDIAISSHTVKGASTPSNSPDPVEQSNTYRFVSSTEPSTVPGLTPVEYSESDSTSVHPLHGVSKLAYDQMVTNCKFIKSICEIQAQFRHTKLKMPDTDCEVCDLYYSTVEQIEALEIEIGLPSTLSPSEDAQSGAMLPVITRLNFYYETLGLEQIRNPPFCMRLPQGFPPEEINYRTLVFLEKYFQWLCDAKSALERRAALLRGRVMDHYRKECEDPNNNTVSDCETEVIDNLLTKFEKGEETTVRLPQKKKKRNKGIKKRRKPAKKGQPPQCQPQSEVEAAAPCEFDTEVAVEPTETAPKKKKKNKKRKGGKAAEAMPAQERGDWHLSQEPVSRLPSEAEADSTIASTEPLSKAKSIAEVSDEELGAPIAGEFIYQSDKDSGSKTPTPGSSEPFTGPAALSREVLVDPSTPSSNWKLVQRKERRHGKLQEEVHHPEQAQKETGKLECVLVSSVSTGNVEKTTGAEDPTPSLPTPPTPTPPPQLAALSTAESGHANLDETNTDARHHSRPIVSSGGAVNREGRFTEPEGSCRASGFGMCGFYRACCYHRQQDLCGCPPGRSCCCLHHAGDCCHCLGTHGTVAELLRERSDAVPSRRRALTG